MRILITGGAGFIGSNLAMYLRKNLADASIMVLDNLRRRGAEHALVRLRDAGVEFIHGDVRNPEDFAGIDKLDLLIECSAEPSVMAGNDGCTGYLVQSNLVGALNCAELCRRTSATMLFLSTSRVYALDNLCRINLTEEDNRFRISETQNQPGVTADGISESFSTNGPKSIYGATKFAAEVLLADFSNTFGFPVIINRCGVVAGPWQFGKADQGILSFWLKSHLLKKPVTYIGFGGTGKQIRDFLHVDDLCDLVLMQIKNPNEFTRTVWNVGGGTKNTASLAELTQLCRQVTGISVETKADLAQRFADVPAYVTDSARITAKCGWSPRRNLRQITEDTAAWLSTNPAQLNT